MGAALAACGALALAGCGSEASGSGSTTTTASSSSTGSPPTDRVRIADYEYGPESIAVPAGTVVEFTNGDDTAHTATADDGSFDTGDLGRGDAKRITFDEPGSLTYYCRFHPFMKATIEVR